MNTCKCWERGAPEEGMGAPVSSPYVALCISYIALFLRCIRYNCVSWWSLALIQHQWESPIWGAVNKETSVQVPQLWYSTAVRTSVKQHCCKMALEQSPPLARQLSSALSCSSLVHSSTPCSGEILLVFHLQPGDTIFTVGWKGKVPSLSQWRADL